MPDHKYGDMAEMEVTKGGYRMMMYLGFDRYPDSDQFGRWVVILGAPRDFYGTGFIGSWEYPGIMRTFRWLDDD